MKENVPALNISMSDGKQDDQHLFPDVVMGVPELKEGETGLPQANLEMGGIVSHP